MNKYFPTMLALLFVLCALPTALSAAEDSPKKTNTRVQKNLQTTPYQSTLSLSADQTFETEEFLLEINWEHKYNDAIGLLGFVGFGPRGSESVSILGTGSTGSGFPLTYELGGQVRYYTLGNFEHGLHLGGEVALLHVSQQPRSSSRFRGIEEGIVVAPFVGYKIIVARGFTAEVQVGAHQVLVDASFDDASFVPLNLQPFASLGAGWSF